MSATYTIFCSCLKFIHDVSSLGLNKYSIISSRFKNGCRLHPWDRWDTNTSVVIPDSGSTDRVMYVVGILRSANPEDGCSHHCLQELLRRHRRIADTAGARLGAKQYLAHHPTPAGWQQHFGRRWEQFAGRKARFDPLRILGPGQGIFPRSHEAATAAYMGASRK